MNKEQEKFLTIEFSYQGWDSVEQLKILLEKKMQQIYYSTRKMNIF